MGRRLWTVSFHPPANVIKVAIPSNALLEAVVALDREREPWPLGIRPDELVSGRLPIGTSAIARSKASPSGTPSANAVSYDASKSQLVDYFGLARSALISSGASPSDIYVTHLYDTD